MRTTVVPIYQAAQLSGNPLGRTPSASLRICFISTTKISYATILCADGAISKEPAMKAAHALTEFKHFLRQKGKIVAQLTPYEAVDIMIAHYTEIRADDCSLEEDGDTLLFQWGIYDWGQGRPCFEYNITRQLIYYENLAEVGEEEWIGEVINELSLTLQYESTKDLEDLSEGNRLCSDLNDVKAFKEFISSCAATKCVQHFTPKAITLTYGSEK